MKNKNGFCDYNFDYMKLLKIEAKGLPLFKQDIYQIETSIRYENEIGRYVIISEIIWEKSSDSVKLKKSIFEFNDGMIVSRRNNEEEFLSDDVSIVIAQNKTIIRLKFVQQEEIILNNARELDNHLLIFANRI